jgi:hypothetical protein
MWLVGLQIFGISPTQPAGAFAGNTNKFNLPSAIPGIGESGFSDSCTRGDFERALLAAIEQALKNLAPVRYGSSGSRDV